MIGRAVTQKLRVMAVTAALLGLAGCATRPEFVLPDPVLLADCPIPGIQGDTNLALAQGYNARGRALRDCNADKAGLRAWADRLSKK